MVPTPTLSTAGCATAADRDGGAAHGDGKTAHGVGRVRRPGESGAAVVEFTLVSVLVVGLFLAVLQVGFALHVRNTLTASAAEGARVAASEGQSAQTGAERTRELIRVALPDSFAADIAVREGDQAGLEVVQVEVRAPLPLVGWIGVDRALVVTGHAVVEDQW